VQQDQRALLQLLQDQTQQRAAARAARQALRQLVHAESRAEAVEAAAKVQSADHAQARWWAEVQDVLELLRGGGGAAAAVAPSPTTTGGLTRDDLRDRRAWLAALVAQCRWHFAASDSARDEAMVATLLRDTEGADVADAAAVVAKAQLASDVYQSLLAARPPSIDTTGATRLIDAGLRRALMQEAAQQAPGASQQLQPPREGVPRTTLRQVHAPTACCGDAAAAAAAAVLRIGV
jgi:hypothetical protein